MKQLTCTGVGCFIFGYQLFKSHPAKWGFLIPGSLSERKLFWYK